MMPPPNCSGRSAARPSSSAAAAGCPSRVRCPRPSGKGSVNSNGSRPEDGEQLLLEGVLFLPPVAGGSHGRPPAECSLSAAPCYVPIPPSRPSTRSLRGEEKSRESCREEREDKSEARARVRGRLARRQPLWLRWQVIPAHHVACGRRWASPCARSTRSVQSCHEPMQGLLRRVVFPTRTWLLKSWRFRAWTTKMNVKFEKWKRTELAARNCSTTHHARAPPICRVPSRLVFDSAILFFK